jgi:hypothetical protein
MKVEHSHTISHICNRYFTHPFAKLRHRLAAILRGNSTARARDEQRAPGPGERSAVGALEVMAPADLVHGAIPPGSPAEETTSGKEPYLAALARDDPEAVRSLCDKFRGRYRYPTES